MKRLVSLALSLVCGAAFAAAPSQPSSPPPGGNRFLFVVDISYSMSRLALASRQAVFELIYFGVNEQMREGDTFGLWTFDQEPHTGIFPMQTWHPDQTLDLASRAAKFLKEQPYEKKTRMEPVLAKIYSVIKMVRDVNVFIITDGETPLVGTPFDKELLSICTQKASARRKAKQPFVITLAARGGTVVRASVTLPSEAITLPPPPPPIETAKVKTPSSADSAVQSGSTTPAGEAPKPAGALGESETASGTNVTAASSPRLAAPTTSRAPIIMTNASAAPRKRVIEIRTLTNAPPQPLAQAAPATNAVSPMEESELPKAAVPPATTASPVAPPADPGKEPGTLKASLPPADRPPSPALAGTPTVPESPAPSSMLLPARTPVAARESPLPSNAAALNPSTPSPLIAATAPKDSSRSYRMLFAAGAVLLGVALGLVFLSLRRLRQARQPSIISRSMEQK